MVEIIATDLSPESTSAPEPQVENKPEPEEEDFIDLLKIREWERLLDRLQEISRFTAHTFLRDFNKAHAYCVDRLSKATREYNNATANRKREYALSMLYRSIDGLKAKGINPTDKTKEAYALADPDYIKSIDEEAKWEATITYLKGKIDLFRSAHDDVRAIYKTEGNVYGDVGASSGRDTQ